MWLLRQLSMTVRNDIRLNAGGDRIYSPFRRFFPVSCGTFSRLCIAPENDIITGRVNTGSEENRAVSRGHKGAIP